MKQVTIPGVNIIQEKIPDGKCPEFVWEGSAYHPAEIEIKGVFLKNETSRGIESLEFELEANIRYMLNLNKNADVVFLGHREGFEVVDKRDSDSVFIYGTFAILCARKTILHEVFHLGGPYHGQVIQSSIAKGY